MRQLLSTQDRSLAESLLIALEVEGIEAITNTDTGTAASHAPATVVLLQDEDYELAVSVLRDVQSTPRPSSLPQWIRWPVRVAFLLVILWAIIGTIEWLL